MKNHYFNLLVRSREGVVFQGQVESISSINDKGKFDVLATHANFISLIQKELVIRKPREEKSLIKITNGLMRVRENNVEVYLGVEGFREALITEQK